MTFKHEILNIIMINWTDGFLRLAIEVLVLILLNSVSEGDLGMAYI